jgi:Fe-S cluster assembly protein SufD
MKITPFNSFICNKYEQLSKGLFTTNDSRINALHDKAVKCFSENGLSKEKIDSIQQFAINKIAETAYTIQLTPAPYRPIEEYFRCKIQNIDTHMFAFLNGWYIHKSAPLTIFPNGVIVGSLMEAIKQYPDLVFPYLAKENINSNDIFLALNEALFIDGLFVYIPDNLQVSKPMQLVSIIDSKENLFVQQRNLIIVGENSSFSFVQCDDSLQFGNTFLNNVTEIFLHKNTRFNYYKMENKDANSILINQVFVQQKENSHFFSNITTFNAGHVVNVLKVKLLESFATAKLYGLYLVDKKQYVENQIFVDHIAPDCHSYQLYKGIADDEATANFNGHIVVRPNAQRTEAFQINRNITLTDNAKIMTKPFLEIYADDVKCSHGATTGQLDDEALYYLRSRGICERNAKMLLMFAFAIEIADSVEVESLKARQYEMIQKRLSGELSLCDQCVLHCSHEKLLEFDIDNIFS